MKNRIGTIYGKPIVEGDANLTTPNEVKIVDDTIPSIDIETMTELLKFYRGELVYTEKDHPWIKDLYNILAEGNTNIRFNILDFNGCSFATFVTQVVTYEKNIIFTVSGLHSRNGAWTSQASAYFLADFGTGLVLESQEGGVPA